jgi:hypothetical protein
VEWHRSPYLFLYCSCALPNKLLAFGLIGNLVE